MRCKSLFYLGVKGLGFDSIRQVVIRHSVSSPGIFQLHPIYCSVIIRTT